MEHIFTDTGPYSVSTVMDSRSILVRSILILRMPMVVVSRNITPSSLSRSLSLQMAVRSHPGRFFFMKTGV